MGKRIKGITIELNGDSTGLQKAVAAVESKMGKTGAALKDVQRLLKFDPGNMTLLAQQSDLLAEQIGNVSEKLKTLKQAQEAAKGALERGEISVDQYRALEREVEDTDIYLRDLNKSADKNKAALEDAGKAGEAAGKGIETAGKKSEKAASDIDKSSKAAEIGKKALNGFGEAAKVAGATIAAGFVAGGTAIVAGTKKLVDASVAASEYADNVQTQASVIGITTDKYQELVYASELLDVSAETYGKALTKNEKSMAAAAKGSGAAADAYAELGVSIMDASGKYRDSDEVFLEAIDRLGGIENEVERDNIAMTLFGKSAKELNPLIEAGSGKLAELSKEAHNVGAVMSGEDLEAFTEFDDSVQRLKGGADAAKNAIGGVLLPVLSDLADDGVDLLSEFTNALKNGDGIDALPAAIEKIMPKAEKAIKKYIPKIADMGGDIIGGLADAALDAAPELLSTAGEVLEKVGGRLEKDAPKLLKAGGELVGRLADGAAEKAPDFARRLADDLTNPEALVSMGKTGLSLAKAIFEGLLSGLSETGVNIVRLIGGDAVKESLRNYGTVARELEGNIADVRDRIKEAADAREDAEKSRQDAIAGIEYEAGREKHLLDELNLIVDANGKVKSGCSDRAKEITGELSNALGIEIDMNGDVIESYQKIQAEIDNTIEKKEALALLDVSEGKYKDAVEGKADAYNNLADAQETDAKAQQELIDAQKEMNRLVKQGENMRGDKGKMGVNYDPEKWAEQAFDERHGTSFAAIEENASNTAKALDEAQAQLNAYNKDIADFESAQAALARGDYSAVKTILERGTNALRGNLQVNKKLTVAQAEDIKKNYESNAFAFQNYGEQLEKGIEGYTADGYEELKRQTSEALRLMYETADGAYDVGDEYLENLVSGLQSDPSKLPAGMKRVFDTLKDTDPSAFANLGQILGGEFSAELLREVERAIAEAKTRIAKANASTAAANQQNNQNYYNGGGYNVSWAGAYNNTKYGD